MCLFCEKFNCEYFLIHFVVYDAYVSCSLFFLPLNKEQYEVCLLFNFNYLLYRYCNVNLMFDDVPTSI